MRIISRFYVIFISLILFFLLFACKSKTDAIKNDTIIEKRDTANIKTDLKETNRKEKELEFIDFTYVFNSEKTKLSDNNLYSVYYDLIFIFDNKNDKFTVSYDIFDEDNVKIISKSDIKPKFDHKENRYLVSDSFLDFFSYKTLRYHLKIKTDDAEIEYVGDYKSDFNQSIEYFVIGPIIAKYENSEINSYLSVEIVLSGDENPDNIKIIPPSENYYWDIPYQLEEGKIVGKGLISDKYHKRYLDNGDYYIQAHFGKKGIIQKKFNITDFFNNTKGANYGLPVASEISSDKNKIVLDLSLVEKIDKMELKLFSKIEDSLQNIGKVEILNVTNELIKKELINMFLDDFGNKIKIKYNEKYYYQIYLYSKVFNDISYISISDYAPLIFQGFRIW